MIDIENGPYDFQQPSKTLGNSLRLMTIPNGKGYAIKKTTTCTRKQQIFQVLSGYATKESLWVITDQALNRETGYKPFIG